ncbi:MAG TPA: polysaccharide deacetylase family protein [Gemmatimonadales bacterium]
MRLVIFTGHPDLRGTAWWSVIADTPGLEAVLICRQLPPGGGGAGRFLKNVRKHGPLWIPYRLAYAALSLLGRFRTVAPLPQPPARALPVEEFEIAKLASPEAVAHVTGWHPDLGLSIGAPILKPALFTIPRMGTLNVHEGAVPEFRGAPPGFWELWFGAADIGATVHWIDAGLDTGGIVAEARAPIYPADDVADVQARVEELALGLLSHALRRVTTGDTTATPQRKGGRTNRSPLLSQRLALGNRLFWRGIARRLRNPLYPFKAVFVGLWLALLGPLRDLWRTIRGAHPIRVFTFHRITRLCRDGMTVSPEVFSRQIEYITRHHDVVGLDRAMELLRGKERLRRPAAAITFDDGYRSVTEVARPIMDAAGVTGTCFVSTGLVATDRRFAHDETSLVRDWMAVMDWTEIEALRADGWSMGGHTANHPRLSTLSGEPLRHEIAAPLAELRSHGGESRPAMAYPFGGPADITPEGVASAREGGYSALFSDFGGENFPGDDLFALRRIEVGGDHETLMWKAAVRGLDLGGLGRRLRGGGAS